MQHSTRQLAIGVAFMFGTVVVAVLGYVIAGWPIGDAIYMVVITVFGVGYGEVRTIDSPGLRIFTIGVIVAGCTALIYIIGGFLQFLTEGQIQRALGARRMTREIDHLDNHVIICGFGRIGHILAADLVTAHREFVILELDPDRIAEAQSLGYLVYTGDATSETALTAVGIKRAATLAVVLPNDAANVFITLSARNLNPNVEIIARGDKPSTERKLMQAGATRVVLPAQIGAERMAHLILHPTAADLISSDAHTHELAVSLGEFGLQIEQLTIEPESPLIGKPLSSIEVRGHGAFVIFALKRSDGEVISKPEPGTLIVPGDSLIVIGRSGETPAFVDRTVTKKEIRYRGGVVTQRTTRG